MFQSTAYLGGEEWAGFDAFFPSGFWSPADPNGVPPPFPPLSPLCTILGYPYMDTNAKNFIRAPLAPIYTSFEGGSARQKNAIFRSQFSKKCLQLPAARRARI